MQCPEHKKELIGKKTRYGIRFSCPVHGCSVVCWGGKTSTPANYETRQARRKAHDAFDLLWKSGRYERGELYQLLSDFMGLPKSLTHIGYFDKRQCRVVHKFIEMLKK